MQSAETPQESPQSCPCGARRQARSGRGQQKGLPSEKDVRIKYLAARQHTRLRCDLSSPLVLPTAPHYTHH